MCERNIDWLPFAHAPTRDRPATQVCALTGKRTNDILHCGMTLNQLSHTGQGKAFFTE